MYLWVYRSAIIHSLDTCYHILREGRGNVSVFQSRVQQRMFGPKRDGNGEWRRLYSEELHNLYRLLNTVRMINDNCSFNLYTECQGSFGNLDDQKLHYPWCPFFCLPWTDWTLGLTISLSYHASV